MAATAAALSPLPFGGQVPGAYRRSFATITCDTSYPTGGYTVTPAQVGLTTIVTADVGSTQGGRIATWNQTTGKLQVWSAVNTEVANATNLSTESVVIEFIGF